mmetsp:Transcript_86019/g.230139  ORF Transcript_86019/g.230139 Transcript_86019/m.230139 type:complete len:227 (+) Transcript_86019:119-799(+)
MCVTEEADATYIRGRRGRHSGEGGKRADQSQPGNKDCPTLRPGGGYFPRFFCAERALACLDLVGCFFLTPMLRPFFLFFLSAAFWPRLSDLRRRSTTTTLAFLGCLPDTTVPPPFRAVAATVTRSSFRAALDMSFRTPLIFACAVSSESASAAACLRSVSNFLCIRFFFLDWASLTFLMGLALISRILSRYCCTSSLVTGNSGLQYNSSSSWNHSGKSLSWNTHLL